MPTAAAPLMGDHGHAPTHAIPQSTLNMSGTECDEMGLWGVERAIHELKVLNRGEKRERELANMASVGDVYRDDVPPPHFAGDRYE